jgi:hypothetical protein
VSYSGVVNQRKFIVITEPTVSDPAWVTACVETFTDGTFKSFSSFDELRQLIDEIEVRQIRLAAKGKGRAEIMELFGITHEQYFSKLDEKREAVPV